MNKSTFNIAVTGHRPDKLWGYVTNTKEYEELHNTLRSLIESYAEQNKDKEVWCISGMALGVDTIFALATMKAKETYPNIKLECAIPCLNHSNMWNNRDKEKYDSILSKADKETIVSKARYRPVLMQLRNEYMVDKADVLIAIWDGSKGGTGNCVRYAQSKDIHIHHIAPATIERMAKMKGDNIYEN